MTRRDSNVVARHLPWLFLAVLVLANIIGVEGHVAAFHKGACLRALRNIAG